MPKTSEATKEEQDQLRTVLDEHETVYCIVRSVSRSGMSRVMDFYVIATDLDGTPWMRYITWLVAQVYGSSAPSFNSGMRVRGTGMDMGWHVIYTVRSALGLGEWRPGEDVGAGSFRPGYGFRIEYL